MAKAYKNKQEQEAPNLRPTFPNAYDYYIDYYSEEEKHTFRVTKDSWANIHKNNNLSQKLTEKELKIISLVSTLIDRSSLGLAYFSLDYLCVKLGITDRQLRTVRKNINHIFSSRWRKATRINGTLKKNVYVFTYTLQGRGLLGNSKYYKSVKLGSTLPTSIYKDEKNIIKDRSSVQVHESNFLQNSKKEVTKKTVLANARKKPTNQERKARIYSPKFKQYDKQKSLEEHYPLTTEECSELQNRSGREFTLNAMNEILLDMSRKPKESSHKFPSKAAFMAYMSKVYRYEGRDAVKTSNSGFKLLARATEAEIIQHTTQAERESYLNMVEQQAIIHRSDETQYRAKLVGSLKPNQAYNFLSTLLSVNKVGGTFEVLMAEDVELTEFSKKIILDQANAIGAYHGVEKLEFIRRSIEPSL